jgi:hypothetical protein
MATQSNRRWLIIGALVLVGLCLCTSAIVISGVGLYWFTQRAGTPTPRVTLTPMRGITLSPTARPTVTPRLIPTPTLGMTPPSARPTKPVIAIPQDQATCLAQGGKWGRIGLSPKEQCNLPAPDAGKVCNDSSECTGLCLADLSAEEKERVTRQRIPIQTSGKCSNWVIVVGCVPIVENGQVKNIVCID